MRLTGQAAQAMIKSANDQIEGYETNLAAYKKTIESPEEQKLYDAAESLWTKYKTGSVAVLNMLAVGEVGQALAKLNADVFPTYQVFFGAISAIVQYNQKAAKDLNDFAKLRVTRVMLMMIIVMIAGALIGTVIAIGITRSVTKAVGGEPDEIAT